jgi:hypothetical protein
MSGAGLPPNDPFVDPAGDPRFDLVRGLKVLVIAVTIMVVITLICVWLA